MGPAVFLQNLGLLFSRVVGFFVVEHMVLSTVDDLVSASDVHQLWGDTCRQLSAVVQKQIAGMDTAELLRVKGMTVLCARTLGADRYQYDTSPLEALLQRSYNVFASAALKEAERWAVLVRLVVLVSSSLNAFPGALSLFSNQNPKIPLLCTTEYFENTGTCARILSMCH